MATPANNNAPFIPQKAGQATQGDDIVFEIKEEQQVKKKRTLQIDPGNLFTSLNRWMIQNSAIKLQEKLLFFELLVATTNAGIAVSESLRLLIKQTKNQRLQLVIHDLKKRIDSGESLAEAMTEHTDVFDEATCSIVGAGEKSGKLQEVLKELVGQYERMNTIQKKVKGVMMYPIIVISVMVLAAAVVLIFVVPKLIDLFGGASELPLPTRIMIGASDILRYQWEFVLLAVIGIFGGFSFWKSTDSGKRQWNLFLLMMPAIGPFIKKMVLSRVARIFSFLINSGVPIIDGLRISSDVAGNIIYQKKLLLAADDLTRGIEISENFADDQALFPEMFVNMIAIGEKTASMGKTLEKVADFYDEDLERATASFSKLIEPIIIVIMAIGAVFMVMAIYLPILQMNDHMVG